jgi:hypothetical protein
MTRKRVLLGMLALLSFIPVDGRGAAVPALAGTNTITTVGPKAMIVRLPRTVRFIQTQYIDGGLYSPTFHTNGSYAAIMIDRVTPNHFAPYVFALRMSRPAGCWAPRMCIAPENHWGPVDVRGMATGGGGFGDPVGTITLPAGTYVIYALTDPGRSMTARFTIPGLTGRAGFNPTRPVAAEFAYRSGMAPSAEARVADPAAPNTGSPVLRTSGSLTGRIVDRGLFAADVFILHPPAEPRTHVSGFSFDGFIPGGEPWDRPDGSLIQECADNIEWPSSACDGPVSTWETRHIGWGLESGQGPPRLVRGGRWQYSYDVVAPLPDGGQVFSYAFWVSAL